MSYKALFTSGQIKKKDIFRIKLDDIKVEPGFNIRDLNTPEAQEHIHSMVSSLKNGVGLPPLEVRLGENDEVLVVDGHCRRSAYFLARRQGEPIEYIDCLPFLGNDMDRVAKMIASSQGKSLTPLETAMGYKRLRGFGLENPQIAAKVGKTGEHVRMLLLLADANSDVQQAVRENKLSAHLAIELISKHGEKAGEHIAKLLDKAKEGGKNRITKSATTIKLPPRAALVNAVVRISSHFDDGERKSLAASHEDEMMSVTLTVGELRGLLGIKVPAAKTAAAK